MIDRKMNIEGRIALILVAGAVIAPFALQLLGPRLYTDVAALVVLCLFILVISSGFGMGVSSIRHSAGRDRVCGIIACVAAFLFILTSLILTFLAHAEE